MTPGASMEPEELFRRYCEEVREDPPRGGANAVERADGWTLVVGPFVFVSSWPAAAAPRALVGRVLADPRAATRPVIWRVYGRDRAAGLEEALADAGFEPSRGALLAFDLARGRIPRGGARVERVRTAADAAAYDAVTAEVFGADAAMTLERREALLRDPSRALFVARSPAGEAIGAAGLELYPGTTFAGLLGGAVRARDRGAGAYRALVAARLEEARARGARAVVVDAGPMSHPVLAHLGFGAVDAQTTWTRAPAPAAP